MTKYAWNHHPNGKEHAIKAWREEHPDQHDQPDPDDATLQAWFVAREREGMLDEWRAQHPGKTPPDDAELRRWYIDYRNMGAVNIARHLGKPFH